MNTAMSSTSPLDPTRTAWAEADGVYIETYRMLLKVAFVLTGSKSAAEDVVHDVFCRVGPRLGQIDNPPAYLRVSVVNQCRSLHRRLGRTPALAPAEAAALDPGLVEMRDALQALSPRRRGAVVLRYLCDLSDEEIAATLDCKPATVRTLLHRGLADLRSMMK